MYTSSEQKRGSRFQTEDNNRHKDSSEKCSAERRRADAGGELAHKRARVRLWVSDISLTVSGASL